MGGREAVAVEGAELESHLLLLVVKLCPASAACKYDQIVNRLGRKEAFIRVVYWAVFV